ncbi:MAG TPA: hypothetical protein VGD73_24485, partial [Pseudonocardia sp.]
MTEPTVPPSPSVTNPADTDPAGPTTSSPAVTTPTVTSPAVTHGTDSVATVRSFLDALSRLDTDAAL